MTSFFPFCHPDETLTRMHRGPLHSWDKSPNHTGFLKNIPLYSASIHIFRSFAPMWTTVQILVFTLNVIESCPKAFQGKMTRSD